MKYIPLIIGVILSLFGLIVIAGTAMNMVAPAAKYSTSDYAIAMVIFGILPLAGGIALCVFAFKKFGKSKVKLQSCSKCNRSLEPGWTTCPHCGEKVSAAN